MTTVERNIQEAARITVGFVALYSVSFWNILISKKKCLAKAKGKPFDRYTDPGMHVADRLQANLLEWSPIFLGLVGALAATDNLSTSCIRASRAYLVFRGVYTALVLKYGVRRNGLNKQLWIATFPAYGCLTWLSQHAVRKLFFA